MMSPEEQQIIKKVVKQLVQSFPIERIILFGSRARGDADAESDYDFLVVMNFNKRRTQVAVDIRKTAHISGIPMDFLIRTPEDWETGFLLKKEIASEGKVVYEAACGTSAALKTAGQTFRAGTGNRCV